METRRLIYVLTGIAAAIVVLIGLLVVATSGGGGDGDSASNGNGDGTPADTGPDLPDRVEGELRLFGSDPITLDPACAADAGSADYIVEIFSGLVSFDQDLNIIPDIADMFDRLADASKGVVKVLVRIWRPLTEAQRAGLQSKLEKLSGRKIAIDARIDPSVKGGMLVMFGDNVIEDLHPSQNDTLVPLNAPISVSVAKMVEKTETFSIEVLKGGAAVGGKAEWDGLRSSRWYRRRRRPARAEETRVPFDEAPCSGFSEARQTVPGFQQSWIQSMLVCA
jgi:hypothetical protein